MKSKSLLYAYTTVNYAVVGLCILYINHVNAERSTSLLAQGSYSCLYLMSAFSTLVESADDFTKLLALSQRLDDLLTLSCEDKVVSRSTQVRHFDGIVATSSSVYSVLIDDEEEKTPRVSSVCGCVDMIEAVAVKDCDVCCPSNNRVLVRSMTWKLSVGARLLITGSSGAGKSTLLRLLVQGGSSTSQASSVRIKYPSEDILVLGQNPYILDVSLSNDSSLRGLNECTGFSRSQYNVSSSSR